MAGQEGTPPLEVSSKAEVVDQLTENVRTWMDLNEREEKARKELKQAAAEKKVLNNSIIQGLEVVDTPQIVTRRGRLRPCERVTYRPFSKKEIVSTIRGEIDDVAKADSIIDKLYNKNLREVKRSIGLKFNKIQA